MATQATGEIDYNARLQQLHTATPTQQEQISAARASYNAAKAEEDRLYKLYAACDGPPLVRDAARAAYLGAADATIAALCKLALALRHVYVRS